MLSIDLLNRYARQIVLTDIGLEGQEKLLNSRVAVIGLGGLGSPAAILLARIGVGYIRVVDRDVVSYTDLHRQPLYMPEDVDLPKVEAAYIRLRELNPDVDVDPRPTPVTKDNVFDLIRDVDIVIDGLDTMYGRYILNRACLRLGKPLIFGSAIEMYGNISTITYGDGPCLECFYGGIMDESSLPRCAEVGVHPSITSIVASIQVSEAVKILVGSRPSLESKLLYIDLRGMEFDKIDIVKNPGCPACGKGEGVDKLPDMVPVELSCARDGAGIYFINRLSDINIESLYSRSMEKGYKVSRRSRYGISIEVDDNLSASILSSGVMIGKAKIHRDDNTERLIKIYKELVEAG